MMSAPLIEFLAGATSGIAQIIVGFPMDTIKVRLQTHSDPTLSALGCSRSILKNEGISALFRGLPSPLVGVGFCNAVVFAANGFFSRMLGVRDPARDPLWKQSLAGGLAGGTVAILDCPIELLKIKCQADSKRYKGIIDAAKHELQMNGIFGLYRGFVSTVIRDIPSYAIYFAVYDSSKRMMMDYYPPDNNTSLRAIQMMTAGGLAGVACWLVALPQDVVKSRMQNSAIPISLKDCVYDVYRESGWRGFWRGITPTLLRAFPVNSIAFLVYEMTVNAFHSIQKPSYG